VIQKYLTADQLVEVMSDQYGQPVNQTTLTKR
jgi:zinc protease